MQKLLRRSPCSPALFSEAVKPASLPLRRPIAAFSSGAASGGCFAQVGASLISRDVFQKSTVSSAMATGFQFRPCASLSADAHFSKSAGSCRICRCSLDGGSRPWVQLKKNRSGSRLGWLHTVAAGEGAASSASEDKPVKFQRRRGNSGNGEGPQSCPDLLAIPGVGPRNLRKLVDNGIGGVAELKQLYKQKFLGESNHKMVEYLQSDVGIIHRHHAESITTFIKESMDEESEEEGSGSDVKPQKKRITLCVEGNISVGKSTFLQRIANETLELRDLVEIVPEPVDKWQKVGSDNFNILDAFYAEPERYAYTFQNYVFVTRVMQERESSGGLKPLRLMERSIFSDRMVFVRAVHEAKWMNEMEISIYDSWFDPVVSSLPGLIPDGFIYLRATPDTCHKRMMLRKREEEGGVSLDYLRGLHEKHESWLFPSESESHGLLSVNPLQLSPGSSLHPAIRDRVFILEGTHMHPSIQKVPALVLDCEPNIDFNRDIEAKQHYACQVAEFFEFVKRSKELASQKPGHEPQSKLVQPQQGRLWVPDGKNLPNLPFQSLDFGRSLSSLFSS